MRYIPRCMPRCIPWCLPLSLVRRCLSRFLFPGGGGAEMPPDEGRPPNFSTRVQLFSLLETPETSIESLDESSISRWSLEVLDAFFSLFVTNRDSGILSTRCLCMFLCISRCSGHVSRSGRGGARPSPQPCARRRAGPAGQPDRPSGPPVAAEKKARRRGII